jgi:hypothetical protein
MNRGLFLIILLGFWLTSCGIPLPLQKDLIVKDNAAIRQFESTDPVFKEYIKKFEANGQKHHGDKNFSIGDIPINFGDTENPMFKGVCFEYSDGSKEIIVQKEWWDNVDHAYRESLIFHELGHCRLGRDHHNKTHEQDQSTFKLSLMNSIIVAPGNYRRFEEDYLVELFTTSDSTLVQALIDSAKKDD